MALPCQLPGRSFYRSAEGVLSLYEPFSRHDDSSLPLVLKETGLQELLENGNTPVDCLSKYSVVIMAVFSGRKLWSGRPMHQTTFSLGDETPCYSSTHSQVRRAHARRLRAAGAVHRGSLDTCCCRVSVAGETTAGRWRST